MFVVLWFLKTYPTDRGATLHVNGRTLRYHHTTVWHNIAKIAARCEQWFFNPNGDVIQQLQIDANFVPALGRTVVGLIDVVPVYVGRMKGCSSVQFQPKYKRCVAKVVRAAAARTGFKRTKTDARRPLFSLCVEWCSFSL